MDSELFILTCYQRKINYLHICTRVYSVSDSASVAKIQEHLRESRQKLEKEKNQRTLLENQYRILQEENRKLHKLVFSELSIATF